MYNLNNFDLCNDLIFYLDFNDTCDPISIDFYDYSKGTIISHLSFRMSEGFIVSNTRTGGAWGSETRSSFNFSEYTHIEAKIRFIDTRCIVCLDGNDFSFPIHAGFGYLDICFLDFYNLSTVPPWLFDENLLHLWRFDTNKSGFNALPNVGNPLTRDKPLKPGLSAIIRAKNEAENIERCIRSISPLVDEVVFVDNGSSDSTWQIANGLQEEYLNLKILSYPHSIPPAGDEHVEAVALGSSNTLGHYYNWCLSHAERFNFMKWDADYIAIEKNLRELAEYYQVRTRGDNISIWYSGLEVYTDGERFWVDRESKHSEFRVFSKRHGAHWVDLPAWEEMEQSYIYKSSKYFFEKPVYLELFRLDEIEFRDRGVFLDDIRDQERLEYIRSFKEENKVPDYFIEISGLDDPLLTDMPISKFEVEQFNGFKNRYNKIPRIVRANTADPIVEFDRIDQRSFVMIVTCCEARLRRTKAQCQTWIPDAERAGVPYMFVVGRPNQPTQLVGDILYVDEPDEYEHLPKKIISAVKFVFDHFNAEYVFKIDDDSVVNVPALLLSDYSKYDYCGFGIASGDWSAPNWHFGKCDNHQLNQRYFHVPANLKWFGGQFGYFLSRKAMAHLVRHADEIRKEIYEDVAIAKWLAKEGISAESNLNNETMSAMVFSEWIVDTPTCMVVCDVPNDDGVFQVYAHWKLAEEVTQSIKLFEAQYRVESDWFDHAKHERILKHMEMKPQPRRR